jgi:type IV fimbrial biogenesis protein FimT
VLNPRTPQGGLSIIEILVALSILGILMALVAPSAGVWIQNTQLRNAAESVLTGMQSARLEALKRNRPVSFRLTDAASTAWTVCIYDALTDACSAAPDAVISSKSASEASFNALLGTDTALSDPLAPIAGGVGMPASTTFDSFGRLATTAPNNTMRVDVRNPTLSAAEERRLVILVNLGGQVRMCDPKLSFATNPQGCV